MLPVLTLHKPFFAEITVPTFLLHIFMVIDKVIQKERSILYEVTSVILRKKCSYERVSNCDWLPR